MKRLILVAVLTLVISEGCSGTAPPRGIHINYNFSLDEVRLTRQREHEVIRRGNAFTYKEDGFQIRLSVNAQYIQTAIQNDSGDSIKIIWDDSSYVDGIGFTHKVTHGGTLIKDRTGFTPPTPIPSGSKFSKLLIPVDFLHYRKRTRQTTRSFWFGRRRNYVPGGWEKRPFFPPEAPNKDWYNDYRSRLSSDPIKFRVVLAIEFPDGAEKFDFHFSALVK